MTLINIVGSWTKKKVSSFNKAILFCMDIHRLYMKKNIKLCQYLSVKKSTQTAEYANFATPRIGYNVWDPKFVYSNKQIDVSTYEGYILQSFIGL